MSDIAPRILSGVPVCGGIAIGPIHRLGSAEVGARQATGDPEAELAAFAAALSAAKAALEQLLESEDELAGEILEFQAILLEDPDLIEPMEATIRAGTAADAAWAEAMDAEIRAYRESGEAVLSARADDLADLKRRVLRALSGEAEEGAEVPGGAIVVAGELTPSAFLALDLGRVAGVATVGGSPTSHVSILARARGVNLVVGIAGADGLEEGVAAILDAGAGTLEVAPGVARLADAETARAEGASRREAAERHAREPAETADGVAVKVLVNIDDPAILETLDPAICDGVGLTRTEFLFKDGSPDEAAQLDFYRRLIAWADGRAVTIRTLDAGGDKPIPGITIDGEANPFLGVRGVRLSLARPDVFRTQLRALARAAADAPVPLKVMVPMVTVPAELEAARAILAEEVARLEGEGIPCAMPILGTMIEVPAAALTAADFDAGFYSIGSNDLVQYVTASARDNSAVAALADPLNPAVLELIARTVAAGAAGGVEVSLCGDMASSPRLAGTLLKAGLRVFSAAPAEVAAVKAAIREARTGADG
ncbi:phosphoenolpyruvate--protein phosphotransferase [Acuticoccus mangrovi]|uniref:Phosphoenolpyruvate-protein phosphotransferase n=1 Tax=Acuticoccus mangrovi TaxID=2796142 RepID=A0A934INA5_9HYPH|nr:phosphoenolpyruvate--protein phosphotransferase [Acuticoccus mangrovi]MBJ3774534.1 phosphoenolpyruvate--protein phosphotransferase [Acuticoccus mangrovi]